MLLIHIRSVMKDYERLRLQVTFLILPKIKY